MNMLNMNLEFIQALNPLYAVPIVAVILCAFIVYAFGFKSPVPPPSFETIEEDKKYSRKKRSKETQKKEKVLQNGKVNEVGLQKSAPSLPKKKESNEKSVVSDKPNTISKASVSDKKSSKKVRLQTDKKLAQEKKKESISQDDFNDDGWVQLVSKKGRKNKKKDDSVLTETLSVDSVVEKAIETNKADNFENEDLKRKTSELPDILSQIAKQKLSKEETVPKAVNHNINVEKSKIQNVVIEVSKPSDDLEKQTPKEEMSKVMKVFEESKPKKKRKKPSEMPNEYNSNISSNDSESSTLLILSEVSEKVIVKPVTDIPALKNVEDVQAPDAKTSNVAFDELAGMYPETKEPKKKKKVRRDH